MKHKRGVLGLLFCLCAFLAVGCSQYSVDRVSPEQNFRKHTKNTLNSNKLSMSSMRTLRTLDLEFHYRKHSIECFNSLVQEIAKDSDDLNVKILAAESASQVGKKHLRRSPEIALEHYLNVASITYDYLINQASRNEDCFKAETFLMTRLYNRSVSHIVEICFCAPASVRAELSQSSSFQLYFEEADLTLEQVRSLVLIEPINHYSIRGIKNLYANTGLGSASMIVLDPATAEEHFGIENMIKGMAYPISAFIRFESLEAKSSGSQTKAFLSFHDPYRADTIQINEKCYSLEAEFTTPLGISLARLQPQKHNIERLFKSDVTMEHAGIFFLERYNENKIPVLMVHGLMSSPETWVKMFNDLRGDPEIRENYQFWLFGYPTGLPMLYSSSILREELNDVMNRYNPAGTNEKMNQMVIVGHSMGGILSRMLTQSSEDHYWSKIFTKDIDEIQFSQDDKEFLERLLFFEPLPYVKRTIFISTPHKGSSMADDWYANLGANLISLPEELTKLGKDVEEANLLNTDADPEFFKKPVHNSVELLSPESYFYKGYSQAPQSPDVVYHSIVGWKVGKNLQCSSDGVVDYASSHIPFARSEKVVSWGHDAHKHPLAIMEVKRILYDHLASQIADQTGSK